MEEVGAGLARESVGYVWFIARKVRSYRDIRLNLGSSLILWAKVTPDVRFNAMESTMNMQE